MKEEEMLDYWINQMQENLTQMTKDPSYADYAYVTFDDIKSLSNLTENENETLIAVRAPPGTSLEVPDPESLPKDEKEKYQIYLQSKAGEILVYIVSNEKLAFSQDARPTPAFPSASGSQELPMIADPVEDVATSDNMADLLLS